MKKQIEQMSEVRERGILVGWNAPAWISATEKRTVFIPRREEEIEEERRAVCDFCHRAGRSCASILAARDCEEFEILNQLSARADASRAAHRNDRD